MVVGPVGFMGISKSERKWLILNRTLNSDER